MGKRPLEWPPGSGVRADYSPGEDELLRGLVSAYEAGRITKAQAVREIGVFHDLKVLLGASLVGDDPAPAPVDQLAMTG